MSDTAETTDEHTDEETTPPDPGISLSVRIPLVLDPAYRQPGGFVIMAWATDTGEALFLQKLKTEEDIGTTHLFTQKLPREVPCVMAILYDGDDGRLVHASTVKEPAGDLSDTELNGESEFPEPMGRALDEAQGDPDQLCALCDENVPDGDDFDRTAVHRECLLANFIGPLGHHLDHGFWCENLGDPHCGRGARQANLDLAALVAEHGFIAVMLGQFPKETGGNGA